MARALVERRLAACGNVIGAPVRSIYTWKGRVESTNEFLLILKSSRRRFAALEAAIRQLHRYQVPEIIALPVVVGAGAYLRWLSESLAKPTKRRKSTKIEGVRKPQGRSGQVYLRLLEVGRQME
jgi:periplasmic divalent cation tolerance protein